MQCSALHRTVPNTHIQRSVVSYRVLSTQYSVLITEVQCSVISVCKKIAILAEQPRAVQCRGCAGGLGEVLIY